MLMNKSKAMPEWVSEGTIGETVPKKSTENFQKKCPRKPSVNGVIPGESSGEIHVVFSQKSQKHVENFLNF